MMRVDVLIIGAGAAGLFAAGIAGQRGRSVLVLEHTDTLGAKILISGGGRCNFTNRDVRPDRFVGANPAFARSALARYTQHDFIDLVRRHGIAFYEKTLGQLFCEGTGSARRIVQMLVDECPPERVTFGTGVRVTDVSGPGPFRVETSAGPVEAHSLILATGGLSIPKLGATGFAFDLARQFALPVVAPRPALVPLTFAPSDMAMMGPLSGVSVEASATAGGAAFREGLLFTHRGLSGPSILQVSSYWSPGQPVVIDLLPDAPDPRGPGDGPLVAIKRERPRIQLSTALGDLVPARLAEAWLGAMPSPPAQARLADLKDADLSTLTRALKSWTLRPAGDEGYAKAEVTRGGIDTAALSQKTMEAKAVPGLYCIGEAVDVTGWLGGYNFQWAWSSAHAAGMAA